MSEKSSDVLPVAGDQAVLARRYVGALVALAEQEGAVEAVSKDMASLRQLWQESAEWRFVATDPRLDYDEVLKTVAHIVIMAELNKLTGNFLAIVAQNRRLNMLPLLIETFFEEVSLRRGESRAFVRVAHGLSDAQQAALSDALTTVVGGKVNISMVEDPSLIGGLTVKIGSRYLDASVKTKLDHLERSLKTAGVAA